MVLLFVKVSVNVNEFQRMNGDSTGAFLTVSLSNTPPQQLDAALQALVGKSLGSKWTILSAGRQGLTYRYITYATKNCTAKNKQCVNSKSL